MRDERALLDEFLAATDAECDACGHGLQGVNSARCPECGRGLRLTVKAKDYSMAPWLVAVVAMALAAGFDGVMAVVMTTAYVLSNVLPSQKVPPANPVLFIDGAFAAAAAVELGLIVLLARHRHAWARSEVSTQWRRSAMIAAALFVVHAAPPAWIAWLNLR